MEVDTKVTKKMIHLKFLTATTLLLASGCASGLPFTSSLPAEPATEIADSTPELKALPKVELPTALTTASTTIVPAIAQVDFQQPKTPEAILPVQLQTEIPAGATEGLTLESLEQMAFSNNPAIAQSEAEVRALRGKWLQVGLAPNPTVGYMASEVGNEGAAGQQGGYVGQNFITAQKLDKNRAVVSAEIQLAEQQLVAMQQRVQTDLRKSYYAALLAQRRLELAEELVRVATQAAEASKSLLNAKEIPLAGLLQTEVQQQNAIVLQRTSQNGQEQAWRQLSAVVGGIPLPVQPLDGNAKELPELLDWQEQIDRLQSESPELSAAMADVVRARRAVSRACVEAVPNISTQVSVQYDNSTNDTVTGIQVGLPLPLWNRNQGGIRQAQAEVTKAVRNVDRLELNLQRRLADAFRKYSDAHLTAETYANDILPCSTTPFRQGWFTQSGKKHKTTGFKESFLSEVLVVKGLFELRAKGFLRATVHLFARNFPRVS